MLDDERQSQQFIREVDEELRRSQLKAIWDRFAPLIIGVCLLVVLVTAGYRGWVWWQGRQASEAGDRFLAAVQDLQGGKREAGEKALTGIAESGTGGYSALARLRLAGEKAAAGQKKDALAGYDAVSNDGGVAGSLRDLARIRAALLALDTGDAVGAKQRAEALNQPGNPWRHAAREVLGTAAYQAGDLAHARDLFTEIQQDAETPPDLVVRSGMMVSLIDGQLAAPGAEGQAPPPAAPAAAAPVEAPVPATGPATEFDAPPANGAPAAPGASAPAPSFEPAPAAPSGSSAPAAPPSGEPAAPAAPAIPPAVPPGTPPAAAPPTPPAAAPVAPAPAAPASPVVAPDAAAAPGQPSAPAASAAPASPPAQPATPGAPPAASGAVPAIPPQ